MEISPTSASTLVCCGLDPVVPCLGSFTSYITTLTSKDCVSASVYKPLPDERVYNIITTRTLLRIYIYNILNTYIYMYSIRVHARTRERHYNMIMTTRPRKTEREKREAEEEATECVWKTSFVQRRRYSVVR